MHSARSIHLKIGQEFIISHLHTIIKHMFPIAVRFSIQMTIHISRWLKNFQSYCFMVINFIFKAVFFIKAKTNISQIRHKKSVILKPYQSIQLSNIQHTQITIDTWCHRDFQSMVLKVAFDTRHRSEIW